MLRWIGISYSRKVRESVTWSIPSDIMARFDEIRVVQLKDEGSISLVLQSFE